MADWRKDMIRERAANLSQTEASAVLPDNQLESSLDLNRLQTALNITGLGTEQGLIQQFNAAQGAHDEREPLFFASAQEGKVDVDWLRYVSAYNEQVVVRSAPADVSMAALQPKVDLSALVLPAAAAPADTALTPTPTPEAAPPQHRPAFLTPKVP